MRSSMLKVVERRVVEPVLPDNPSVFRVEHGITKGLSTTVYGIHLTMHYPSFGSQCKSGDGGEPVTKAEPRVEVEQLVSSAPVARATIEPAEGQGFSLQDLLGRRVELRNEAKDGGDVHIVEPGCQLQAPGTRGPANGGLQEFRSGVNPRMVTTHRAHPDAQVLGLGHRHGRQLREVIPNHVGNGPDRALPQGTQHGLGKVQV